MEARISVVIASFNGARFLPQCLDSFLAQTRMLAEIVVVDDGSTDDTAAVLEPYLDRVRHHKQRNMGVCVARNIGFNITTGNFVTFIDVDDWVDPTFCEKMAAALEAKPDAALVYCDRVEVNDYEGRLEPFRTVTLGDRTAHPFRSALPGYFPGSPGATMIRRSALHHVGLFDPAIPNIGEDWDLLLKITRYFPIAYVPEPLFHYRFHPTSATKRGYIRMLEGAGSVADRYTTFAKDAAEWKQQRRAAHRELQRRAAENWIRFLKAERAEGRGSKALPGLFGELRRHPELIKWIAGISIRPLRRKLGLGKNLPKEF